MRMISGNIYLQWQVHGKSTQWQMGTSPSGPFSSLNSYGIAPNSDCTFHFSTNQSGAVFATMTDNGDDTTYGVQFGGAFGSATLTITTQGSLSLQAGQLISGDPKIQLSSSNNLPTSCNMDWNGKDWTVTDPSKDPMQPDSQGWYDLYVQSGTVTVNVTDETANSTPHYCAVYYGSKATNSGNVQSETYIASTKAVPITIRGNAGFECTLNLFSMQSPSGSSTIAS